MSRKHRNNPHKQPNKAANPPVKQVKNPKDENVASNDKQKPTKESEECPQNVIYVEKRDKRAENWNKASVIISGVLMLFTVGLFWQNNRAINAAIESTRVADSSLIETRSQFQVTNTPYLAVIRPEFITFGEEIIEIGYQIENLTTNPVLIVDKYNNYAFDTAMPPLSTLRKAKYFAINRYITKETPYKGKATFTQRVPLILREAVMSGVISFYFYTEIRYKNLVNNKTRRFECVVKISPLRNFKSYDEVLHIDNRDME